MNAFLATKLAQTYHVVSAFDGHEGLEKALEIHPDLILCDVMMPRLSGDQMVRELRRRRELDDVPIVILTAKVDEGLRVALLKEGAQDLLHKPVNEEHLLAKVERLIADRRRAESRKGAGVTSPLPAPGEPEAASRHSA
jgi:DNA-binding response OmpR family regulator